VIEKYGSGIKRIVSAFKNEGLQIPVFENFQHGFMVTVFLKEIIHGTDVTDNVTDSRLEGVLEMIRNNNRITAFQLAKHYQVSKRTILRDLEQLKKNSTLRRIGSEKGGRWVVIDNRK